MDRPFLSILTDEGVRRFPLGDEPVTIGRAEQNNIVILDLQASRFHCEIGQGLDGRWFVRDLDSRNGTKLNGKRIQQAPFGKGDVVRIGTTEIRLVMVASEPLPPPGPIGAATPTDVAPPPPPLPPVSPFNPVSHPLDPPSALTPMTAPPAGYVPSQRTAPVAITPMLKAAPANGKTAASSLQGDPRSPTLVPMAQNPRAAAASESLDDLEVIEEETPQQPQPTEPEDEDAPLKVEITPERAAEETKVALVVASGSDEERILRELADGLPDSTPSAEELKLLDDRGEAVGPLTHGEAWKYPGEAAPVLRHVLVLAARAHATEIHIEPRSEDYQLRLRLDGSMADGCRLSRNIGARLCALVKLLCDMDPTSRNIVQEGHFCAQTAAAPLKCRVSFTPSIAGQKLVLRLPDSAGTPAHLADLHMPVWMQDEAIRALASDTGLVLVAAPAASGRTTTLYALLRDSGVASRDVTAIEDPVEAEIEGVTQVLVNADQGHTFLALLRSLLRQGPDVVMVGELRDPETARAAVHASTIGQLILSSLYARDAAGALGRLVEWGVEPYAIASSLQLVIAQRLVRQLCPHCKRAISPTSEQLSRLGEAGQGLSQIFIPTGCPRCLKTGFAGRRAFFEALVPGDDVREAIASGANPREMDKVLSGFAYERLPQAGYRLVAQGLCHLEEVERSIGPQPRRQA